jgi:hypothetical protein
LKIADPASHHKQTDDFAMASLWDSFTDAVKDHYNYDQVGRESDALAQNRYTSIGQQDAFQHAYVSALLALRHSLAESKLLGDARESWTTYKYYSGKDNDYRTDTYRDLYNNAVGRAIGAYAKQNGLTESEVADLVEHAVSSGQAIVSIRNDDPDPRLPYVDSEIPSDLSGARTIQRVAGRFSRHPEYLGASSKKQHAEQPALTAG